MLRGSYDENWGCLILLCWTNSQFNNKTSNKKASTAYIVMMEEIKPFVVVFYYDKIEPEEADE